MKLKWLIHTILHIGCVALLLLEGHRIQQLRRVVAEGQARDEEGKRAIVFFQDEHKANIRQLHQRLINCYEEKAVSPDSHHGRK
jgi:hypothetical protein